jgi:drug/metabolite transporter (DMT)-like permease
MPPTPSEINTPVLLEQARRYVDAEHERIGSLQTRAAALLAAIVVLVGLTLTVESQLGDRDIPRVISLLLALLVLAALGAGGWACVRALAPRGTDVQAPQTIGVLQAPGFADTEPVVLNQLLITTLAVELDAARIETHQIDSGIRRSARMLALGVLGVFALAVAFGVTHEKTKTQNVKLVAPIHTRVDGTVQAQILAPIRASITGQVHAKISVPITVLLPHKNHKDHLPDTR